ncbi:hypothetical protein ZIOFF_003502 [Zingiber officinale]|uniref:ARM repeat superfamily protein n=1 Tax=Zingiber officinale TaxID=94328 RepID=A0A8J5INU1_ZINOF|nr:hypothetical protein ZIOFF_003502 [Zingiber officinale]
MLLYLPLPSSPVCSFYLPDPRFAKPPHSIPSFAISCRLSKLIRETLSRTLYAPPVGSNVSIKLILESLLPCEGGPPAEGFPKEVMDFVLCCAALAAAEGDDSPTLFWVTKDLILAAKLSLRELSRAASFGSEREMLVELMPDVLSVVKGVIKESSVDTKSEDIFASSAKTPVDYAIVAAHQFRWLVSQVAYPDLGKLLWLVTPCALTSLDHWSAAVKEQGISSFIHIVKNVNAAELSWYEEAILDVCCSNIPAADELWHRVIEISVLLLTSTQKANPRSPWFERMLNEMLSHLERQPFNKERRVSWLSQIEPVFSVMGLFILAHFRRIFPLFFQWMHADDEDTILLVLGRLHTIIKLTWIRKSPHFERLVDELTLLYKETAVRKNREVIRHQILRLLVLLQQCKGLQFEKAWDKHKNDPDLTMMVSSFNNLLNETQTTSTS